GGGYELALACHWRVATDSPKTQLGLPEIQLGVVPALGGCVRLPRLIGPRAALDIILTGKAERAAKALKLGMVDEVVPRSILRQGPAAGAAPLAPQPKPHRHTTRVAHGTLRGEGRGGRSGGARRWSPVRAASGVQQGAEAGPQKDRRQLS